MGTGHDETRTDSSNAIKDDTINSGLVPSGNSNSELVDPSGPRDTDMTHSSPDHRISSKRAHPDISRNAGKGESNMHYISLIRKNSEHSASDNANADPAADNANDVECGTFVGIKTSAFRVVPDVHKVDSYRKLVVDCTPVTENPDTACKDGAAIATLKVAQGTPEKANTFDRTATTGSAIVSTSVTHLRTLVTWWVVTLTWGLLTAKVARANAMRFRLLANSWKAIRTW